MSDRIITGVISVLVAIIGVAIVAALISQQAQTANVVTASGNAFTNILKTALSPVTNSSGGLLGSLSNTGNLGNGLGLTNL